MHLKSFWQFFADLLAVALFALEVGKLRARETGAYSSDFLRSTDVSLECRFLLSIGAQRLAGDGVLVRLPFFDESVTCKSNEK